VLPERLRKAKIRRDVSRLNTDIRDLDFDEIADGFDLKDDPQIYKLLKELSQREALRAEVGDYHDIIPDPGRPGKWTFSEYKESDPVLTHNQQNASLNHYLNSELSGGYMPSLPMDTNPALMAELEEAVKALMSRETLEKFGGKHGMHGGTRRVSDQPGVMAQYIHDLGLGYDRVYRDPITHQKPNQGHIAAHASSDVLSHLKENIRLQGGHLNQILRNEESDMVTAILDQMQGRRQVVDQVDLDKNIVEIKAAQNLRKKQKQQETRQKNKEVKMKFDAGASNLLDKRFADARVLDEFQKLKQSALQEIDAKRDAQAAGAVVGEKPTVINAGEGSRVYVEGGNGNGNGHKVDKIKAAMKNGYGNGKH